MNQFEKNGQSPKCNCGTNYSTPKELIEKAAKKLETKPAETEAKKD